MHPYLIDSDFGSFHLRVPTYGVLLALAFMVAYFEALRRAYKLHENPKHIENIFFLVVISSIIGSRLFHVFFEDFNYYKMYPLKIFSLWEGGYTFYGAVILSVPTIFVYSNFKKISAMQLLDISAPSTAIGLFIGRLGCFSAGCCWGKPTNLPWAVTFSHPDAFTIPKNVPLHPTQLYESLSGLIIFFYLIWLFKKRKYLGQIFFHGLISYGIARFIIEFFRGDDYRGFIFEHTLSYSQFICLMIFPFALLGIFVYSRHKKVEDGTNKNK